MNLPAIAERRREAIDLFRGDFLEGFYVRDAPAFEEWAAGQRERLRQLAVQAMQELAAHYAEHGDHRAGIEILEQLLRYNSWRESAHRQLMELLVRSGQRDAALMQFERCRRVLQAELDVEPEYATIALAERIRSGSLGQAEPITAVPRRTSDCPSSRHCSSVAGASLPGSRTCSANPAAVL